MHLRQSKYNHAKQLSTIPDSIYSHPQRLAVNEQSSNEVAIPAVENESIVTDLEYNGDDHTEKYVYNELDLGNVLHHHVTNNHSQKHSSKTVHEAELKNLC